MGSDLSRPGALFAALLALVPHRTVAPATGGVPSGSRSSGPLRLPATPLVPYPGSLQLLDALDGARRSSPGPGRGVRGLQGTPAIGYPDGLQLLERVLTAGDEFLDRMEEMSTLAWSACAPSLTAEQSARLEGAYQAELARLAELTRSVQFDGIPLLDGAHDVQLVLPRSGGATLLVDLPDWRPSALGLAGTITSVAAAYHAAYAVTPAWTRVTLDRLRLSLASQELVEGGAHGGLREIERLLGRMRKLAELASNGVLNTGDRTILDQHCRSDLARLDEVAEAATFEGLLLLDGGQVLLQGALGTTLAFDLPDVDATSLGLPPAATDVTTLTSAATTLETLGEALREVQKQREAVLEARDALTNGFLRLR